MLMYVDLITYNLLTCLITKFFILQIVHETEEMQNTAVIIGNLLQSKLF